MEKLKILKELVGIKSFDVCQNKEIIDYLELQFKPYSKEYLATFKQPNVPSNDGDIVGKHRWRKNKKTKEIE